MNSIHNTICKISCHFICWWHTLCSSDANIGNNCNRLQFSKGMNKEVKNMQIWLEINRQSLTTEKTKVVIFHKKVNHWANNTIKIEWTNNGMSHWTQFLRSIINQHLSRNGHVQMISNYTHTQKKNVRTITCNKRHAYTGPPLKMCNLPNIKDTMR